MILGVAGVLLVLLMCSMAGILGVGGILLNRVGEGKIEPRQVIIKRLKPVKVDPLVVIVTPAIAEDLIVEVKESVLPDVVTDPTLIPTSTFPALPTPVPTIAVPVLPPPPNIGGQTEPTNLGEIGTVATPVLTEVAAVPPLSGWPVGGQVTQNFGCSSYYTGLAGPDCLENTPWFHDGLDIANIAGAPVRAALAGTVIFAEADPTGSECGDWKGYGLVVIIDSGQGWQTLYGHLSRIDVTIGQVVTPDSIIGAVGDTGCTTGPHLHFGMNYKGVLVDPSKYVPH